MPALAPGRTFTHSPPRRVLDAIGWTRHQFFDIAGTSPWRLVRPARAFLLPHRRASSPVR